MFLSLAGTSLSVVTLWLVRLRRMHSVSEGTCQLAMWHWRVQFVTSVFKSRNLTAESDRDQATKGGSRQFRCAWGSLKTSGFSLDVTLTQKNLLMSDMSSCGKHPQALRRCLMVDRWQLPTCLLLETGLVAKTFHRFLSSEVGASKQQTPFDQQECVNFSEFFNQTFRRILRSENIRCFRHAPSPACRGLKRNVPKCLVNKSLDITCSCEGNQLPVRPSRLRAAIATECFALKVHGMLDRVRFEQRHCSSDLNLWRNVAREVIKTAC